MKINESLTNELVIEVKDVNQEVEHEPIDDGLPICRICVREIGENELAVDCNFCN